MNKKYYDFADDIRRAPNAWLYCGFSRRGPGKTYSTLKYMLDNKKKFIYLRRDHGDIEIITTDNENINMNPFKPINRDFGTDIHGEAVRKGVAYFKDQTTGEVVGYALSLPATGKGFDVSEADFLIFDEFIPKPGQIVKKAEGRQLLSYYMTVTRDRLKRGRPELKLILFGNPDRISCPIIKEFNLTDEIYQTLAPGANNLYYNGEKRILIHNINEYHDAELEASGIAETMAGSAWASTELGGAFGYDDFSKIEPNKKIPHGSATRFKLITDKWAAEALQTPEGYWYLRKCKNINGTMPKFNFAIETDIYIFWQDFLATLQEATINGRALYASYDIYDLIMHFDYKVI